MLDKVGEPAAVAAAVQSFVALGDSFSEGVGDPRPDGSGCRGWADRVAEQLAVSNPGLRYANLAIRGKLLGQVVSDQVPAAVAMRPDLVSIAAGGNDLLRPGADPDDLAQPFADAVAALAAASGRVMVFTGFNPATFPLIRLIRGKVAAYNAHLRIIAARHDCLLIDLWSMRVLRTPALWCDDRLHMSPEGHRRVALRVCEVLGVPGDEDWRAPVAAAPAPRWLAQRRADARWARAYAAPWIRRRLTGASSGDGMVAKRPDLLPF
ncbi:MAG TPA: SGNH/GDSL hydrolase family protein [Streptosporangiaceae bacterium]|nr:SGNH/GDSL hydrolase family protein [Streptosporangiaceae bacterium]